MATATMDYRVASVDDKVAEAIDKGTTLDINCKKIESELKGLKNIITAATSFESDEISVRLKGKTHTALVTKRTSYAVENPSKQFEEEFVAGKFGDVVRGNISVNVQPSRLPELMTLLQTSGFTFTREFDVDADVIKGNKCSSDVLSVVNEQIKKTEVLAVKFEQKKV